MEKLNIEPKQNNGARQKLIAEGLISSEETVSNEEFNSLVDKTNELVEAVNSGAPITAFNFLENVPTYEDLPLTGNHLNDGYGVLEDGLIYVWNGSSFPLKGNGINLGLKPLGKVRESDPMAVSGGEVETAFKNTQNLIEDSFFQKLTGLNFNQGQLKGFQTERNFLLSNLDSKYRRSVFLNDSTAGISTLSFYINIEDLGLSIGDVFCLSAFIKTLKSRGRIHYFQRSFANQRITPVKYSNYVLDNKDYAKASLTDTIIEGCTNIQIVFERYDGIENVYWTGLSINKGNIPYNYVIPKKTDSLSDLQNAQTYATSKYPNQIAKLTDIKNVTAIQNVNGRVGYYNKGLLRSELGDFFLQKAASVSVASIILRNTNFWQAQVPMAVILPVWLNSVDGISNLVLSIRNNKGVSADEWIRESKHPHFGGDLKKGWNILRWDTSNSRYNQFGIDINSIKIDLYSNSEVELRTPGVYLEYTQKAKMMFVNDHGRSGGWLHLVDGQTQNAIKDCEDIGMKVTFALNPLRHEQNEPLRFSMQELESLKNSPIASFSFHSYAATVTKTMSALELKNDAKKSINWLLKNGFGKPSWRACFTQNLADSGMSNYNFMGLDAIATWKENISHLVGFPLFERDNVRRFEIHNRTIGYIDEYFEKLKKFKGVSVPYTHAIVADDHASGDERYSVKLSVWNYFVSKCIEGKSEGWLEFVDYEDIVQELNSYEIYNDEDVTKRIFELL